MTFNDIEEALGRHLAAMTNCPPIAWENRVSGHDSPYLTARRIPTARIDDTLDCIGAYESGIYLVTIIADGGGFTTEANTIAQQVADHFPKGLRLPAGAGNLVMNRAPEPVPGFHDKAKHWCVPVRFYYQTEG